LIVTGKWTTYEVEHNDTYYHGSGRNWMERMGESLESVWDHDYNMSLIDRLEQAVKDYEYEQYRGNESD
jgi:hypothetical protein